MSLIFWDVADEINLIVMMIADVAFKCNLDKSSNP